MKMVLDLSGALTAGLERLRAELELPKNHPPEALAEAKEVAVTPLTDHADRTDWPFVTLDPASSTDFGQVFHIEQVGGDLLLHYAIADVGWFVRRGWCDGT